MQQNASPPRTPHRVAHVAPVPHDAQHRRHAVSKAAVVQDGQDVHFLAQRGPAIVSCMEGRGQGAGGRGAVVVVGGWGGRSRCAGLACIGVHCWLLLPPSARASSLLITGLTPPRPSGRWYTLRATHSPSPALPPPGPCHSKMCTTASPPQARASACSFRWTFTAFTSSSLTIFCMWTGGGRLVARSAQQRQAAAAAAAGSGGGSWQRRSASNGTRVSTGSSRCRRLHTAPPLSAIPSEHRVPASRKQHPGRPFPPVLKIGSYERR